jgi:hypothetical protein
MSAILLLFSLLNVAVSALGNYGNAGFTQATPAHPAELRRTYGEWQMAGEWLRENVPPDTLIAVTPAGYIAYFSELQTIDMLGLNDAHIAHASLEIGGGRAGHEKFDVDYVLRREPDIIVPYEVITDIPLEMPPAEYLPVEIALWQRTEFHSRYALKSTALPDGRWLNLYIRQS